MSEVPDKYRYGTAISVRVKGEYLTHQELASLLDELNEHAFTVTGGRDNWEGPMLGGTEVVMWITFTGGAAFVVGFFQKLGENTAGLCGQILDTLHKAGRRKQQQRGEPPHMVIQVGDVRLLIDETQGELTQEDLATAFLEAAVQLEAGELPPSSGPIETFPRWDKQSKSWGRGYSNEQ